MKRNLKVAVDNSNLKMIVRHTVSGLSHHDYALVAKQIEVGDELVLEHRENNLHDAEAVAVLFQGEQIGWLPNSDYFKNAKGILWRMLKNDVELRTKVISHDLTNPNLQARLYIGIYIRVA